jgi:hypothetical protein
MYMVYKDQPLMLSFCSRVFPAISQLHFTSLFLHPEHLLKALPNTLILFYAEAGHAIVGALMPEYDPVAKISIIPRGGAGGLTFFTPSEERLESGLYSRSYLENQMAVALGGRIAEEIIYGPDNVTTGASNDFQQVGGFELFSRTRSMRSKRTIRFLGYHLGAAGFSPCFRGERCAAVLETVAAWKEAIVLRLLGCAGSLLTD